MPQHKIEQLTPQEWEAEADRIADRRSMTLEVDVIEDLKRFQKWPGLTNQQRKVLMLCLPPNIRLSAQCEGKLKDFSKNLKRERKHQVRLDLWRKWYEFQGIRKPRKRKKVGV